MRDDALRLQRLHALRCRMAEAATVERKRIEGEVRSTEQALNAVRHAVDAALRAKHDDGPCWRDRHAMMNVAAGQSRNFALQRECLADVAASAAQQERAAVQAREQIGRMVERLRAAQEVDQSRREQARMDDLFAITRLRAAMATNF